MKNVLLRAEKQVTLYLFTKVPNAIIKNTIVVLPKRVVIESNSRVVVPHLLNGKSNLQVGVPHLLNVLSNFPQSLRKQQVVSRYLSRRYLTNNRNYPVHASSIFFFEKSKKPLQAKFEILKR